jgi:hypothetical protein
MDKIFCTIELKKNRRTYEIQLGAQLGILDIQLSVGLGIRFPLGGQWKMHNTVLNP